MMTYEANNLLDLAKTIADVERGMAQRPEGYSKPVLTIVNSNFAPVYTLIVTER